MNTCAAGLPESLGKIVLYSHLIPAGLILCLVLFALIRTQGSLLSRYFFAFGAFVSLWLLNDLVAWGVIPNYYLVYFFWSWNDFLHALFLLYGAYFFALLARGTVSLWEKVVFILLAIPPFLLTITGNSISGFQHATCEAVSNTFLTKYILALGVVNLCYILVSLIIAWGVAGVWQKRLQLLSIGAAMLLFFGIFGGTEYYSSLTGLYDVNLYSLFILPLFIMVLAFAITNLGLFDLRFLGFQILAYLLVVMIGAQFLFLSNSTDQAMTSVTLVLSAFIAVLLIQNARREVQQRQVIEAQEAALEVANAQQVSLINFISHEVKGALGKGYSAFGGILEGDYGAITPELKTFAGTALVEMKKGVSMVMDILDASNLKKGTLTFKHETFDLGILIARVCDGMQADVAKKSLTLHCDVPTGEHLMVGDAEKIEKHVVRNLVDNAVRYTPAGDIWVSLSATGARLVLSVKDSGVGIVPDDFARLFTEGGKGKDSTSVNVASTGYGLFIAKQVVSAHDGSIHAESAGKGQGSTFVAELPRKD